MLDDLKRIHERDSQDALGMVERQWQQLDQDFEFDQPKVKASNIVYAGMGSSALVAEIIRQWTLPSLPMEVVRDYDIPHYVSSKTYFIAASYSGSTIIGAGRRPDKSRSVNSKRLVSLGLSSLLRISITAYGL